MDLVCFVLIGLAEGWMADQLMISGGFGVDGRIWKLILGWNGLSS